MIKELTADLALPLYSELPNLEPSVPDIESDYKSGSETTAPERLEYGLQRSLSGELQPLYVRG
jgi:hypothetical protein